MARYRNPFNTLLGRLALLTICLVLLEHLGAQFLVLPEIVGMDADHARRAVELADYAHSHPGKASDVIIKTLGVHFIPGDAFLREICPEQCGKSVMGFDRNLQRVLAPHSRVVSDLNSGTTWIRYGSATDWQRFDNMIMPSGHFANLQWMTLLLAIIVALLGAWQFQRPLHRLAEAARRFRSTREAQPVAVSGPTELKVLIGDFNAMVEDLSVAERERGVMLAGVAHDLKAPVARIMVRADLLQDEALRAGFVQDAEGMSRIITQFLEYARPTQEGSERVAVEAFCREYYEEEPGIHLVLEADADFLLPCIDLERILSNLVGNARCYGSEPIDISTRKQDGEYLLCVRDHGNGVPQDQLLLMLQPFVRLHSEHRAHSGLGLSIVRKLVHANQGRMYCENAEGGGLQVILKFRLTAQVEDHPSDPTHGPQDA